MMRQLHRNRLTRLSVLPILAFLLLGARLGYVQLHRHDHYIERAAGQQKTMIPIRPKRGTIRTSDGEVLAVSTPAFAIIAESRLITQDHRALARRLAMILGGSAFEIERKLLSGRVLTLARKVSPRLRDRIELLRREFGLSRFALRYEEEGRRHYPHGTLAAHVVGYVGLDEFGDNKGLEGIELSHDEVLRGSMEQYRVLRTAMQRKLEPVDELTYRKAFGADITLTIQSALQFAAERALAEKCTELEALSAAAIVTEVKTGRILAAASWPPFDVNHFGSVPAEHRRNRVSQWAIEPGSVAKIFSIGLLLNDRVVSPYTLIDCEGGRARLNGRTIKDSPGHYLHVATIADIFKYSSNVGTNKAALLMEPARFYEGLCRLGLGERTDAGLPGESTGFLPPLYNWSGFTMTSLPMGYEMRTTPLQVAQAVGAVANGGVMMKLQVIEEVRSSLGDVVESFRPAKLRRVLDPLAAQQMLDMMELVVLSGTGTSAAVKGYRIGGKTGTARKYDVEAGGYTGGKYYASFAGILPLSDPEYLIYVVVDEPKGKIYGGSVAAPIFRQIAEMVIRIRGLAPDAMAPAEATRTGVTSILAESATRQADGGGAPMLAEVLGFDPTAAPTEPAVSFEELMAMSPEERYEMRRRLAEGITPSPVRPRPMPELRGLTLSEARAALHGFELSWLEVAGSGLIREQEPAPGTLVGGPARVLLRLDGAPPRPVVVAAEGSGAVVAGDPTGVPAADGVQADAELEVGGEEASGDGPSLTSTPAGGVVPSPVVPAVAAATAEPGATREVPAGTAPVEASEPGVRLGGIAQQ